MNRADVLARRQTLREEKNRIMGAIMDRWDVEMKDMSVEERQKALIYGRVHTDEEDSQLREVDRRIGGCNHMLNQGFFREKQAPRKDEEEEPLY